MFRFQPVQVGGCFLGFGLEAEPDEDSIGSVLRRITQRLIGDRHQPTSVLACALRDQLLGPESERSHGTGRGEGHLVAALEREGRQRRPEPRARIVACRNDRAAERPHRSCPLQQLLRRQAGESHRDEPEVREGGVSPADVRRVLEAGPEAAGGSFFGERGPGIRDRHEAVACGAHRLLEAGLEVPVEAHRLQRRSGLAGNDKERGSEVDLALDPADGLRVGAVQNEQSGPALPRAERTASHLRGQAAAAHSEQDDRARSFISHLGGEVDEIRGSLGEELDGVEPAKPSADLSGGLRLPGAPDGRIPSVDPSSELSALQRGQRRLDGAVGACEVEPNDRERFRECFAHPVNDRDHELVEGLDELLNAFVLELPRHAIEVDARSRELLHDPLGFVEVESDRVLHPAVVGESLDRGIRHRVHGVGADQRLHVADIVVQRVLRARRRPQHPLHSRPRAGERLPPVARRDPQEPLVCQLGVRHGGLSEQTLRPRLLVRPRGDSHPEEEIRQGVDPAEEETGHRRHVVDRPAFPEAAFQALDVGQRDRLVAVDGEQQGDVHADAAVDALFDRGYAGGGPRNLDEDVGTVHPGVQPTGFLDGGVRVMREVGGDLEAHVAIDALGAVPYRPQHVARVLNVPDDQLLVDVPHRASLGRELRDLVVVVVPLGDRLVEDRRVGRHAPQSVIPDASLKLAGADHPARQVVQPVALAVAQQLVKWVHFSQFFSMASTLSSRRWNRSSAS